MVSLYQRFLKGAPARVGDVTVNRITVLIQPVDDERLTQSNVAQADCLSFGVKASALSPARRDAPQANEVCDLTLPEDLQV